MFWPYVGECKLVQSKTVPGSVVDFSSLLGPALFSSLEKMINVMNCHPLFFDIVINFKNSTQAS